MIYAGSVLLVALILSLFLDGPGPGGGNRDTADLSEGRAAADLSAAATAPKRPKNPEPGDVPTFRVGSTLSVLIDEFDYYIDADPGNDTEWTPATAVQIARLAQQVPGDSNGIRVHIQKRVTARASAEQKIRQILEEAGIAPEAVFESATLLD